jgi:hypothetical protein
VRQARTVNVGFKVSKVYRGNAARQEQPVLPARQAQQARRAYRVYKVFPVYKGSRVNKV